MTEKLPALTGPQLIRLLLKDGWVKTRRTNHGQAMQKDVGDRKRVTVIPTKNAPLPPGTLADILSVKQTCVTRKGLSTLIKKHGVK